MYLDAFDRFWAFSSAAALAIILFYWLCGGVIGKIDVYIHFNFING